MNVEAENIEFQTNKRNISICRVCLTNSKRLEIIANTQLQTIFEKLTSNQLITGDGRPESVCYECHRLLQKCCKFVDQSRRAEKILKQFLRSGVEQSIKSLMKNCAIIQSTIPHTLTVANTTLMSIPNADDEDPTVFMKTEPEEIKWEVTIDVKNVPVNTNNIKMSNENDSSEAEPFYEYVFDDRGSNSSYIAGPTTTQKQDVPVKICDEISDVNSSMEAEAFEPESTFDADRDTDSNVPDPTKKQDARSSGFLDGNSSIKMIKSKKVLNSSKSNKDLLELPSKQNINFINSSKGDSKKQNSKLNKEITMSYKLNKIKATAHTTAATTYDCEKYPQCTQSIDVQQHIGTHSKPLSCHHCFKTFASKTLLCEHMPIHDGEKPYACHVCANAFKRQDHLTRHIKIHTGEKPHACHICSKKIIQKSHLRVHIRTHTGEKPYACKICSKKFGNVSTLKVHDLRIHVGKKLYECLACPRKFLRRGDLKKHVRSHTGEKPYLCDKCPASFAHKYKLNKHKTIHSAEMP